MPKEKNNLGLNLYLPKIPPVKLVSLRIRSPKNPLPSVLVPPISPRYPVPPIFNPISKLY